MSMEEVEMVSLCFVQCRMTMRSVYSLLIVTFYIILHFYVKKVIQMMGT